MGIIGVVIAGIVAYIAWQQHKTNRDKLRFDLYNKRYEVFRSLMILLGHIIQQGNIKLEQIDEFSRASKEAVFLFEEDIETYLKTIRKKAGDLWAAEETMNPLPRGEERSAKVAEVSELCRWFIGQSGVAIDKFGKYLKFEQMLKGKAMNWKKGFRRITFVLAVFIAFSAACLSVLFILEEHSNAKSKLTAKRYDYYDKYGYVGFYETEGAFIPDYPTKSEMNYKTQLEKKYKELSDKSTMRLSEAEQMPAIRTLLNLENGFWVNLPKSGLTGLCVAGGLVGAIIGFVIIWLIYRLLEWFAFGFAEDKTNVG